MTAGSGITVGITVGIMGCLPAVAVAAAAAAAGAGATPAVAPSAAAPAPAPVATVTALLCPDQPSTRPELAAEMFAPLATGIGVWQAQGVTLSPSYDEDRCRAHRSGQTLAEPTPDLIVALWLAPQRRMESARARVTFRWQGHDVTFKFLGRELTGTFASKTLPVPEVSEADHPVRDPSAPPGGGGTQAVWPDLVVGLAGAVAHRQVNARSHQDDDLRARAEGILKTASGMLARVDGQWLAAAAPLTGAVVKQVRAALLFDQACPVRSPRELLDAAARLAPYSANSRVLVALARLREMYTPSFCAVVVRDELFHSLVLDPWNNEAVDDLGVLYELALNARPETDASGRVSVDEAAAQLDHVWKKEAPRSPLAWEVGIGASLSSAADQSLRELGPGLRLDLSYGRDGSGWGGRLGVQLPWARQRTFPRAPDSAGGGEPWVGWTRPTLELGPRYRQRFGSFYGEIAPAFLLAAALATGHGFFANYTATGANLGAGGNLRFGRRVGRFSLWVGSQVSYFFGTSSVKLMAEMGSQTAQLPKVDLSILAGASALVWR